jgi:aldose 1-epimerase
MKIAKETFGTTADGESAHLFTCTNDQGLILKLSDFGAHIIAVEVPDRDGKLDNITLGFNSLDGYQRRHPYFGSTVGRFCNRIAHGKFSLDGTEYSLALNNGPNHLHGGLRGFDRYVWQAEEISREDEVGVCFSRVSVDGEEGYPGNLTVSATYTLNNSNEVKMEFVASADAATPINLTNHAYWNLAGAGSRDVLNHQVQVNAEQFLAVDESLIPIEVASVQGTPLDFLRATEVGSRLDQVGGDPGGYDHCYVLQSQDGALADAARVSEPRSGRVMEVLTTQPGLQFYTGNFLDGTDACGGFDQHAGLCLETQHFPDSPNRADFPSAILRPGETFRQVTIHRFSTD